MASLLDSTAAFKARAVDAGLQPDEIQQLEGQGIGTLNKLAYAVTQPTVQPSETQLRGLANSRDPDSVTVGTLSSLRRLMFESQTLAIAHVKQSLEGNERKAELVPAERASRIAAQKGRLAGLELTGALECELRSCS